MLFILERQPGFKGCRKGSEADVTEAVQGAYLKCCVRRLDGLGMDKC